MIQLILINSVPDLIFFAALILKFVDFQCVLWVIKEGNNTD